MIMIIRPTIVSIVTPLIMIMVMIDASKTHELVVVSIIVAVVSHSIQLQNVIKLMYTQCNLNTVIPLPPK